VLRLRCSSLVKRCSSARQERSSWARAR
jgi:hypothetical protein